MNGFVRKEFLADGYMIKEFRRMYELERPILKNKQYINVLDLGDRMKSHHIVNTMSDKLCLSQEDLMAAEEKIKRAVGAR